MGATTKMVASDPTGLSPGEAVERFIRKRRTDATDRTLRSYESRLEQFVVWCDDEGIETVGDISPWHIDEFDLDLRDGDYAATTIKGHLTTLRVLLKYLEGIGAVEEDLHEAVSVPNLDKAEESSDEKLATEDAQAAIQFFRNARSHYGVPMHAFLELAWHTGARMGSIRGLDLEDFNADAQYVWFRHRPSTGTPLKNKQDGERKVGLSAAVCDVLETYIARERSDKRDEHGRSALFCGRQGRPSFTTLRAWSYQATQPCLWTDCPHGKRRATCEWTERSHCSKCPSSRSPHRIRAGSITWQRNKGEQKLDELSTRVNAGADIIAKHYDRADQGEEFEKRRRAVETALDIEEAGAESEADKQ